MTTITKERIELFIKNPLENGLTRGEQMELARIALASLEAEPVAWTIEGALAEVYCGETGMIGPKYIVGDVPLYRHAQPAPVVPEEMPDDCGFKDSYIDGWNACRASMLNGGKS
ncbi:TPA: Eaa protein [Salmonella enterica subsp. enterica serovar Muenchen]|uniref:hypothetical protein n=1 Tax=Salmonella enterica TaxID=28901 RepID=UPI0009AD6D0B|nr:hypothetical protein [Salmonella enterica]HAF5676044.1 Eaa protein [Salmonella enterica]